MGIDFTMVPNKGPKILNPIVSRRDVEEVKLITDANSQLPFVGQTLRVLHVMIAHHVFQHHLLDSSF